MSDDLDLRSIDRRHEPDPRFVAELGERLEAILASSASADVSADGGSVPMVELGPGDSERPPTRHHSRLQPRTRRLIAAACLLLLVASVGALDLWGADDPDPAPVVASAVPAATGPVMNGWVALDSDGDIYLVRPGEDPRRLEVAGSDAADDSCPTWSPDGTRLSFGRLTGSSDPASSDAELVIVSVGLDGAIGAPNVIALDGFHAVPGFAPHPCATWAPDGRWVAFAGGGEVWVADTHTGAIRRLPDLRPMDLEWRPGSDELAIAGDLGPNRASEFSSTPVTVYSVSTGALRQLGSVRAAHLTWSPDGSTLAYTGGENDPRGLWLVDADGADERLLTHVGAANHGVGPVWSPTGERIAYQRLLDLDFEAHEMHEVVLVNVADGNETVLGPPETDGPIGRNTWYPFNVTWSPDGTTLLYSAWSGGDGVLAVHADTPTNVTVLTERSSLTNSVYEHSWVPGQMWGRQPG